MYTDRFSAYKLAVVNAFRQKQAQGQDVWMLRPTRHQIKQLCCQIVEIRLEKRDEDMLYKYLEMKPGDNDYLTLIKKKLADDFRGFEQFLIRPEKNTSEKNVELLAWLIDFPARPYARYIETGRDEPDVIEEEEEIKPAPVNDKEEIKLPPNVSAPEIPPTPPPVNKIDKRWSIGIAALLIGGLVLSRVWPEKKCMYWSDDRYVKTYCDVPRLDTPLLPIDRTKLQGFRKIKKTDTLTSPYALDHFWFVRVADSLEVYTARGTHPLHPDQQLQPVTDYVVNFCKNHSKYGKP